MIGPILDSLPFHRRTRGYIGLGVVSCFVIASWGGGLSYQLGFTREDPPAVISYKDKAYGKPAALVFFCESDSIVRPAVVTPTYILDTKGISAMPCIRLLLVSVIPRLDSILGSKH